MYNYYNCPIRLDSLTRKMFGFVAKIILMVGCAGLMTEAKAEEGQKTNLSSHVSTSGTLQETGETRENYMLDMYLNGKTPKNSSMADRQFAPAYRMRETPYFALKTNILHDLTTSLNLGVEVRLGRKITLDVPFTLNPWMYNKEDNMKFKFFLVQPELRYWTCEAFNGHFFGLHGHYAYYNVGHLPTPPFSETMNLYRFEGQLAGAGISYGYHWLISPRWSFEAEIGAGYARLWYDKYPCQTCAKLLTSEKKNYWGLTRAGLSFLFLF